MCCLMCCLMYVCTYVCMLYVMYVCRDVMYGYGLGLGHSSPDKSSSRTFRVEQRDMIDVDIVTPQTDRPVPRPHSFRCLLHGRPEIRRIPHPYCI
jgi:hypothetical protein